MSSASANDVIENGWYMVVTTLLGGQFGAPYLGCAERSHRCQQILLLSTLQFQPTLFIRCPVPSSSHVQAITTGVLAAEEPERGSYHRYTFVEAPQDCQKG